MSAIQKKMSIEPDDCTSRRIEVNGYPVILRFSSEPTPHLYQELRTLLVSSFTMDTSQMICNNNLGRTSTSTLKTEDAEIKSLA